MMESRKAQGLIAIGGRGHVETLSCKDSSYQKKNGGLVINNENSGSGFHVRWWLKCPRGRINH